MNERKLIISGMVGAGILGFMLGVTAMQLAGQSDLARAIRRIDQIAEETARVVEQADENTRRILEKKMTCQ